MMVHIFQRGNNELSKTLVLLHGTGGDEYDLLDYGRHLDPDANLLGIRGNVIEQGMNRFFKRNTEGVFDQVDLTYRTKELVSFIQDMSIQYEFLLNQVVLVGYSNGANIASSILLSEPTPYLGALLHHPMVPFRLQHDSFLSDKSILILAGTNDPICPKEVTEELFRMYESQKAKPKVLWFEQGHRLTSFEMNLAKVWYDVEILKK